MAVEAVEKDGQVKDISPDVIKDEVQKIRNRKAAKEPKVKWKECCDDMEVVPPGSRQRSARRNALSLQDKISIACQILIKKELFQEVAKEFRTSQRVLHYIIKKVEK